jgi:hypothetical protein
VVSGPSSTAPKTETPALPAKGGITFRNVPSGTFVSIDGSAPKALSGDLAGLDAGKHALVLTREGCDPLERTVRVKRGEVADFGPVAFTRQTGTLRLATSPVPLAWKIVEKPADADAAPVSGKGGASLEKLPTGTYVFEFSFEGLAPFRKSVTLARGAQDLAVTAPGGSISVTSNAPGASVADASGRVLGKAPLAIPLAAPGSYQFSVSAEGYSAATVRGKLDDGGRLERSRIMKESRFPSRAGSARSSSRGGAPCRLSGSPPRPSAWGARRREWARGEARPNTATPLTQGFWLGKTEVTQAQWAAVRGPIPAPSRTGPAAPTRRLKG